MHGGDTLNYTMVVIHFHEFCTKLYFCESTNYIQKQGEHSDSDDDDEFQDLQPTYKRTYTINKVS
jgi:hypothetical protein